ncbi:MAG: class I SAM-dependent methyltransferase [Neptuniibacter sp.]
MANDIIIEAWNTVLFDKFSRFKYLFIEGYASISEEIFSRELFAPGAKVLDVGCGFGDSTIEIAKAVGPTGQAVGVDCASNFIAECQRLASEAALSNAQFLQADVEADALGEDYDEAFARFGTMFFTMPGRAMANIFQSLKPGGRFTQVVWRKREDNPWLHDAERCVKEIVPVVSHDDTDAVHCGPGPFSMAGPDMVSDMLSHVGFEKIRFERFDTSICIGRNLEEAVHFALEIGPAGEIIRLAEEEGERLRSTVKEALADVIASHKRPDGSIWAPSSAWFVTSHKPK